MTTLRWLCTSTAGSSRRPSPGPRRSGSRLRLSIACRARRSPGTRGQPTLLGLT
nr:MRPS2 protein [Homo sapiens]